MELHACLDRAWFAHTQRNLRSKAPVPASLSDFLHQVLVDRAQFHLYRGDALKRRIDLLLSRHNAWRDAFFTEKGHIPQENEALDFLAMELAALEKETPDARIAPNA